MLLPSNPTNVADPFRRATPYDLTPAELGALRRKLGAPVSAASLPVASNRPIGSTIRLADLNYAEFYTDGSYWRPQNGSALIIKRNGSVSAPLGGFTGGTAGQFTLGAPISIPAFLIAPHSSLHMRALVLKTGANGTAKLNMRLGTTGTIASDPSVATINMLIADQQSADLDQHANFGTLTGRFTTNAEGLLNSNGSAVAADKASNVNTQAAMLVTIDIAAANALDSFALLSYSVWLEG